MPSTSSSRSRRLRTPFVRRATLVAALAALVCVVGAPAAQAKHGQLMLFDAASSFLGSGRTSTFDQLDRLGVNGVRMVVSWGKVAPDPTSSVRPKVDLTDPASYNWAGWDLAVADAKARHMKIVLTLAAPPPKWATEGAVGGVTRPRDSDFQAFVTAAGRKFGTAVTWWSPWNEPNLYKFLGPQFVKHKPEAGLLYRGLFLAARAGLDKAGLKSAKMLMGETAPRGNNLNVAPLALLRQTLCLNSKYKKVGHCKPLPVDGFSHHPYTTTAGPYFSPPANKPDDVTLGTMSRLESALDKAAKAKAIKKHLPIFLTEFGVQSYPDHSLGVSLAKQSDYRSLSEYLAWKDPRIASFSQYLLNDDGPVANVPASKRYSGWESGLIAFKGHKRKPVYDSFRTPLAAYPSKSGKTVTLWGLVRPATGKTKVTVQYAGRGGSFHTLKTVTTKADTTWTFTSSNPKGRSWRVLWTAPDKTKYVGPRTLAYKDTRKK
jgi:hypothetical protein